MYRSVCVGALLFLAAACSGSGGSAPVPGLTEASSTVSEQLAGESATGSELAGVAFDVRRDPG